MRLRPWTRAVHFRWTGFRSCSIFPVAAELPWRLLAIARGASIIACVQELGVLEELSCNRSSHNAAIHSGIRLA